MYVCPSCITNLAQNAQITSVTWARGDCIAPSKAKRLLWSKTMVKHESNTCSFDQCKMQSMNPIQWWVCIRYSCLSGTLCSRYWSFADPYADVAVLLCISRVKRREEEICSVHQEEKRKKMIIYKRWPDATTCKTRWNNLLYKMKRFLIDVW